MKKCISQLKSFLPHSSMGRGVTLLICLTFLLLPFQTPLFHKLFKHLSLSIIPSSLALPPYFPPKIAFFPTEFILIALFCLVIRGRWLAFFWSGPSKYLTLLFSTALLSLGASSSSTYLLMYTRFLEVALILVLFNTIRIAFNKDTLLSFLQFLAWMLFTLSLIECFIGLLQFFMQDHLGLKAIGECDVPLCQVPTMHRWIFNAEKTRHFLIRASGTFPHPNIFGGFLFFSLLNTFYLYFTHPQKKLLICGILIQIPALILSFSRSAIIAFTLTTLVGLVLQCRYPYSRKAVLQLTLTFIAIGSLCLYLFYPQLCARGGIINYNPLVRGADSERLAYQKIAIDMVKDKPLLGIGLNNFQLESHHYFPKERLLPSKTHNIYLLIAAETGLIGLTFFLLFLFSLLKHARRAISSQEGLFLFLLFSGFLFIGCCDYYLLYTPHGQILFFSTAALLEGACRKEKHNALTQFSSLRFN